MESNRYKVTAIEETPKIVSEYYVSVTNKDTKCFKILNSLHPNFDEKGIICFSETDFPVIDLEVVCEDDIPTEENKEGFSLNSCSNPDEIFDGIMDHFDPYGNITDIVSCEDENLPENFKSKFLEFYNSGNLDDFEFDQEDYSVEIKGKMEVEKI